MDIGNELSQFLSSRRAKVTPAQAGLPTYGRRQVPGLRREEVASLAGVSVEYYKRLERGNATGASDTVLDALADALQLDDAERTHLFDLARAAASTPARRRQRPTQQAVRPAVRQILDTIGAAATVSNLRGDYLAANTLGRALYAPLFDSRELSTRSEPFRQWWAAHNVRYHQSGRKRLHHPVVGELNLSYEVMELTADSGLRLAVFQTEPGSASDEALDLLASWAATPQPDAEADEAPRP